MPVKTMKEVYESKDHLFGKGSGICAKCGVSISASRDTECVVIGEESLGKRGVVA